jgi:hypothetical protein
MPLVYHEYAPTAPLAEHIECFWTLEGAAPGGTEPDRILPDGRAELVWNLADAFVRYAAGSPPRRQPAALLVGQITGPPHLAPTGRIHEEDP